MLWNGSAAAAQKKDLPIKLIWPLPKEAGFFGLIVLAITKNAQNVECCHKMIDFILRPDIAFQISEQTGYLTAVEKSRC